MGSFEINTNINEVIAKIHQKRAAVDKEVEAEIKTLAKDVRTTLYGMTPKAETFSAIRTKSGAKTTPITVTGGRARASLTQSPRNAGDAIFKIKKYDAEVGTTVPYMKFLEDGTRGHGPKNKKWLRFATTDGVVFAKFVRGIRPHRIFARTRMMYKIVVPKRLREAVSRGLAR